VLKWTPNEKKFESLWRGRVWDAIERLGGDGETNAQGTRSTRRQAGKQRVCSKAVHRDDGAEETEKRTKEEKRLSTKVKSRKSTRRVKRGG